MLRKIGRFDAYAPERDFFQTFLEILALTNLKPKSEFDSPLHRLHRFFFGVKSNYPDIFQDIYFNHDPEFPYSEDIEECFSRLQESVFITRPNPSLNRYRVDVDLASNRPDPKRPDFKVLQDIAKEFEKEFKTKHESLCGA
jgi:hypothetical protein